MLLQDASLGGALLFVTPVTWRASASDSAVLDSSNAASLRWCLCPLAGALVGSALEIPSRRDRRRVIDVTI